MKTIRILTTVFILLFTLGAHAQKRDSRPEMTPEQQATKTIERLDKQLTLTDKQKKELQTFYTASFKKRHAEMQKNKNDRNAMRENMKKDKEVMDAQLKKTLTPAQYKKYKDNEEKRKEAMKNRGGNPNRR